MEVYILDSLLRRVQVVDNFESLIWTERYRDIGDVEIVLKSNVQSRSSFVKGAQLAINNSYRVMTVETIEDGTDSEGKAILTVKGRSLEALLESRVAKDTMSDLTTEEKWVITDTPGNVVRTMFNDICVLGNLDPADIIPFITSGSLFPADTIIEPSTTITWEQELARLFDAMQNLCEIYDLGFRLVRNFDTSELYFDVYAGSDRTSNQTDFPPVVFSPDFGNLQNTKEFSSMQEYKNVAYVFSQYGFVVVYADGVDPAVSGLDRRVLLVNDSSVAADNPDITAALTEVGKNELAKTRGQLLFDGEVTQYGGYIYGVDYFLGDIVETRDAGGNIRPRRVTEQILVHDSEGERSYPTLSSELFDGLNTWESYTSEFDWADFTTEHWADL